MFENLEQRLSSFVRLILWVALFYVLFLVFKPAMKSAFIYDDIPNIVENSDFRQPDAVVQLFRNHPISMQFDHRPVVGGLTLLNFKLFGLNVGSYHAFNLFVHWCVAGLLCELLILVGRRLGLAFPRLVGVAVAGAWALHPLNSATVIFVSQRAESLMILFYLAALYAILASQEGKRKPAWLVVCVGSAILAMGSKEVAVTLPVALLTW